MINVADELHAATEQGIIASSSEIGIPNSEETVAEALARQQEEIDELEEGMPDDYAKEETVGNFRSALMGANGILRLRPLYGARGALIQYTQDTTHHIIIRRETNENELGDYSLQKEIEGAEAYGYTIPEVGEKYSFPFGAKSGMELMEPSFGGAMHSYVPTIAPANIVTLEGFNFEACGLVEITEGLSITFVKEVKYYNHINEQTQETECVKDDDESGIDYATTEGYVYLCSVYLYSVSAIGAETNLPEIKAAIKAVTPPSIPTDYAKEATLGNESTDTQTSKTVFGWLKKLYLLLTDNVYGLDKIKQSAANAAFSAGTASDSASSAATSAASADGKIGTEDNAASAATLFGRLKQANTYLTDTIAARLGTPSTGHTIAGDVESIKTETDKIGTATSGKPATLFAAIEAINMNLTQEQINAIVTAIQNGVTLSQLNTSITNAGNAATAAGTAATTAGQTASLAAQSAQTAAADAASVMAEVQELMSEAEVLAIPHQAAINIIVPQEHSGAVANLAINPNVMYTLGNLTALSLIMQTPADANVYNEYMVQFYCQTGFTLAVTHYDGQTTVLFPYGAACEAGHHYALSIVNNMALLAKA